MLKAHKSECFDEDDPITIWDCARVTTMPNPALMS